MTPLELALILLSLLFLLVAAAFVATSWAATRRYRREVDAWRRARGRKGP